MIYLNNDSVSDNEWKNWFPLLITLFLTHGINRAGSATKSVLTEWYVFRNKVLWSESTWLYNEPVKDNLCAISIWIVRAKDQITVRRLHDAWVSDIFKQGEKG